MPKQIPSQFALALVIVLGGGAILGGEYLLVRWYPNYKQQVAEQTLLLLPYRNETLGIEMKVAAGLYGEAQDFAGGVRITRPKLWSVGPSLVITSRPNLDGTYEFSPEILAKWQTAGTYEQIPRYRFERARINRRDAVLIWQYRERSMYLTARVISPERIVEADCTPGRADEALYLLACEESLGTIQVAGPEPPSPSEPVLELVPPTPAGRSRR